MRWYGLVLLAALLCGCAAPTGQPDLTARLIGPGEMTVLRAGAEAVVATYPRAEPKAWLLRL